MALVTIIRTPWLFVVLVALAAGCGRTDANGDPQTRELERIYEIYQLHVKNHQRPPAELSDLKQYERIHPSILRLLQEGKYIVVWNVNDKNSGTVLAYEKDAPTNGGWAVMANGTVKRLNADAFQSVPKQQP
jgi:hypothetical protein